jgi:hypothetical protein
MKSLGSRVADRNEFKHERRKSECERKIAHEKHDAEVHRNWVFPEPCARRCDNAEQPMGPDGFLFQQWHDDRQGNQ